MVRGGGWVAVVAAMLGVGVAGAGAQVTRVATFENYVEGQGFPRTFTDPLSGITFRDPSGGWSGYVIEYSTTEFGGGNYLDTGGFAPGASPS